MQFIRTQGFRSFGLRIVRQIAVGCLVAGSCNIALAQQSTLPDAPEKQSQGVTSQPSDSSHEQGAYGKHHILWIIPNYRVDESQAPYAPLEPHEKFKVAVDDSFDPSAFLVAGVFAGLSMAQRQYSGFGDGGEALAKYYAGAFADQAIGNMMTEALFPIALHQDPRYFTKGHGGFFRRTGYAISREVITRKDDGADTFNTSEIAGNLIAAGISNAYYPATNRSVGNTMDKWGQQLALDTFFNVAKEFWPDVRHKVFHQE